jgi:hypothetical protein
MSYSVLEEEMGSLKGFEAKRQRGLIEKAPSFPSD